MLAIWVALISFPVANWRISPQQFIILSPAPGDLSTNIFYFLSPIWRTGYPQNPFFIASWRVNFIFFLPIWQNFATISSTGPKPGLLPLHRQSPCVLVQADKSHVEAREHFRQELPDTFNQCTSQLLNQRVHRVQGYERGGVPGQPAEQ